MHRMWHMATRRTQRGWRHRDWVRKTRRREAEACAKLVRAAISPRYSAGRESVVIKLAIPLAHALYAEVFRGESAAQLGYGSPGLRLPENSLEQLRICVRIAGRSHPRVVGWQAVAQTWSMRR